MTKHSPWTPRRPGAAAPTRSNTARETIRSRKDGKPFKALTRYLCIRYSMTPAQHRARRELPDDSHARAGREGRDRA